MSKVARILKYSFILLIIAIFTSCASTQKSNWTKKRKQASRVNTTQLGRNRFFYSPHYQKKLYKSYRNSRYR
ncbi:MAG: hypothetical protein JXR66_10880 [Bacteroidales bacterium]|nr:hypothetical protein [Bacteroidales bacterium]MBN2634053.1 hypothetical protein [Bacteroidales bacterium]